MINSIKKAFQTIFLSTALMAQPTQALDTHIFPLRETQSTDLFDWRLRFFTGTKYNMANLNESKTMPIYSEGRQLSLKAGDGWGSTVITPGLEGVVNLTQNIELTFGADLELDFAERATGDNQRGMYDYHSVGNKKDSSEKDILAYDQLTPEILSLYPFAGINFKIPHAKIGIGYSIPVKRFNRGWGYKNQNQEYITSSESYRARGSKVSLNITSREYERFTIGGILALEQYNLERLNKNQGDVKEISLGIFISKRF